MMNERPSAEDDQPAGPADHPLEDSAASSSERDRVERFEAAYNRIDRRLTELANSKSESRRQPFASKLRTAANRYRRLGRYVDFLLEIGELRNAIVHNRLDTETYIAVPNQSTVEELERIEHRMFSPEQVMPRFAREVVTLEADQPLAEAWQLVRGDGYSRYPVYDGGEFVGLLTSNGFARYCAERIDEQGLLSIDTRAVTVAEVLEVDHRRNLVEFVKGDTLIEDADHMYTRNPRLEAILITEHGKSHHPPVGMICAPDIAALEL